MKLPSTFSHMHAFHYGPRLRPTRDWLMLLIIFAVLLLASLGWNVWLFSQATKGNIVGATPEAPQAQIELEEIKTLFAERSAQQARYIQEYRFVDPSL